MSRTPLDTYAHGTLVIWPTDDLRAEVNLLRQRYDPVSAAICEAHITITEPFVRTPTDADFATITSILVEFEPVTITVGPIGAFLPYSCMFLSLEPLDTLTAVHDALQATGLSHPDPSHFDRRAPHLTILEGSLSPQAISHQVDALRDTDPHGSFVCSEISHVLPDDQLHFRVIRRFTLGKDESITASKRA